MKRVVIAAALLVVAPGAVSATVDARPVTPYASLNAPPELVTGIAGGPAVVLVDEVKQRVTGFEGGGPCGDLNRFDPQPDGKPEAGSGGRTEWIVIGAVAVVAVGLALVLILFRRSGA